MSKRGMTKLSEKKYLEDEIMKAETKILSRRVR